MRFALMIEPQQGMSYGDQLAVAKRAEANGFEALFRSDHYASFPGAGRHADHRRLDRPRRAGPRDRADRARRARVAGHVPAPRHLRQGRHDRRRDERRPDRGRRRAPAGTTSSIASSACRSRRSRSGPTCSRTSWRSCTACGASRTAGRSTGTRRPGRGRAVPARSRWTSRADRRTPIGGARPRIIVGRQGSPAVVPARGALYADEFNLSLGVARRGRGGLRRSSTTACRAIGRDPATLARSAMAGVLVGRDEDEVADARGGAARGVRRRRRGGEAWLEERRQRWVYGTPDQARAEVRRFADAGVERIMLQDFLPWDLDMIDVMGEALVGQV